MARDPRTVRVVDVGTNVASRFAARLMALSGADVRRIYVQRAVSGAAPSEPFLDCYLDDGVQLLDEVSETELDEHLASADVVFTTFDAGRYTAGVDDDRARRRKGSVVHVTTSSFGTTGQYASWRGGPLADWAAGGYLFITGEPDKPPLIGPLHMCGYVTGFLAAVAAEAGLVRAARFGTGTHVDLSAMESMLSMHQSTFERVAAGVGRVRTGRITEVYPLTVRPCRDGHVALGVVTDEEFERFLIAIDRVDLVLDERFADTPRRMEHRQELDAEIDPFLQAHDAAHLVDLFQEHGVPCAKVASELEVLENPQLLHRSFFRTVRCAEGTGRAPGNPVPLTDLAPAGGAAQPEQQADERRRSLPDEQALPLEGLVVLDFTAFWAGPSSTRNLADLGATVIMVERPGGRLEVDLENPDEPAEMVVQGLFLISMNRGKKSVVVDLRTEEGRQQARQLAARADVLVENFRPGVMERFGLGPRDLLELNPRLVYVSLSGFGNSGPWSKWGSYGPMIEAASSIEHRTGYAGGEPLRLGHTLPDGVGGLAGTMAALRGLRQRATTNAGSWWDISQLEAYVSLSGEGILAADATGRNHTRCGNRWPHTLMQGVFPCTGTDEWIAIRATTPVELDGVLSVLGLQDDPARSAGVDALEQAIADATARWDKVELAAQLQARSIEAFPALTPNELLDSQHLAQRGFFQKVTVRNQEIALAGSPLSAEPPLVELSSTAPDAGEHNAEVLGQALQPETGA